MRGAMRTFRSALFSRAFPRSIDDLQSKMVSEDSVRRTLRMGGAHHHMRGMMHATTMAHGTPSGSLSLLRFAALCLFRGPYEPYRVSRSKHLELSPHSGMLTLGY